MTRRVSTYTPGWTRTLRLSAFLRDPSRLRRLPKLGPPLTQLSLQPLHDRAVHLADAAFGKIERRPDLLHCQLFVVIQNDDQPLVAIEALGHQPHQVRLLNPLRWILA